MGEPLLSVDDLQVSFDGEDGRLHAVDGVSFALDPGEVLAIVGESGCGKSVTAMTLIGLTRSATTRINGSVAFGGQDLLSAPARELRRVRGAEIAMIFQDPMSSLNPVHRIGPQIVEQIRAHERVSRSEASARALALLERVGMPSPREHMRAHPHRLSGGMRQRAMIAMALSCSPAVLIADEPTTALDVTIQAQVIDQIKELTRSAGMGVILVTHDIGVVAEIADRVAVMYAGRIVEEGTVDEVFYDAQHPYTWGLLGSIARIDRPRPRRLASISGQPPSLVDRPRGCHFRPRCPHEFDQCVATPELAPQPEGLDHRDRCWLAVADKRERRDVGGRIGLAAKKAPAP